MSEDMSGRKPAYYVASFSGGKDSTAMVLHMLELNYPLDEVVFCDTTMDFPGMLRHVEKIKRVVEDAGIKFTTLRAKHDFEYYLTSVVVPSRSKESKYLGVTGYGWPSNKSRWCTSTMKLGLMSAYFKDLREEYDLIQYVGIAADEDYRMERKNNRKAGLRFPLRAWNWTEADAMAYCREKGYDWEGLYDIFHRVSCWLCPLQVYENLRKLRKHFPDLWQELLRLDARQWQTFAHGYHVSEIDQRFALEDALAEQGYGIHNRRFFADLKRLLNNEVTIEAILEERGEEKK